VAIVVHSLQVSDISKLQQKSVSCIVISSMFSLYLSLIHKFIRDLGS